MRSGIFLYCGAFWFILFSFWCTILPEFLETFVCVLCQTALVCETGRVIDCGCWYMQLEPLPLCALISTIDGAVGVAAVIVEFLNFNLF